MSGAAQLSRTLQILIVAVTVLVGSKAALAAEQGPAPAAVSSATSEPEALQEIQVTAHRLELEKRVSKFVNQIAATENNGEGLARWEAPPVCPLVSGLPRQDGEFILGRLSQIARVAGVPLADEHCAANLYILVTSQPEDLLRGMEKRNRSFTFGYDESSYPPTETPASVVDEFIKTPRAVRVWYSSAEKDAGGRPLAYCQLRQVFPQCGEMAHDAACDPNRYVQCGPAIAGGSRLVFNAVWMFSRVFVIVDQRRLQGVSRQQLADYVAMVSFAKLKPDVRLADATTILKLFDAAPEAAPTVMTEWDQTFLKSLYSTEQKSKLQRSQIVHQMVHAVP